MSGYPGTSARLPDWHEPKAFLCVQGHVWAESSGADTATNKKASVNGSTFYEFKNGKVVSSQIYWDMVTLLAQIGMMPGM